MARKSDNDTDELATLRRELEAERAARTAAETNLGSERQARRTAEQANMSAQERALVTQQEACDSKLESLEAEIEGYENDIARFKELKGIH